MGTIHDPLQVLPITAIFSRHPQALAWAAEKIRAEWGEVALKSEPFAFEQTHYYDVTMGTSLRKQFLVTLPLMTPDELVERKHQSNAWEELYAREFPHDEPRPLNIDPGYLDMGKLVLASSKDFAHRIYMARGIYAEITLFYRHGQWCDHPWTFPDYRENTYHPFFHQCRHLLRTHRPHYPLTTPNPSPL